MAEKKTIIDEFGVIFDANKILPDKKLKLQFLEALAELQNNECYKIGSFPKTNLHRVKGYKQPVYRAYVDKISGWRIHLQLKNDGMLHLRDIIVAKKHDKTIKVVESKRYRYS
jgi:hypothetical protein